MNYPGRENTIKKVQKILKLKEDGIDGEITWNAILSKLMQPVDSEKTTNQSADKVENILSDKSYNLILKYEVGGGSSYYNKALKNPTYPGGASGVTIGVGYDLGYNTKSQFENDWKGLLSENTYNRLEKCLGFKGESAKRLISSVKDISIDWDAASTVFKKETLPRFMRETLRAFPGADKLHPDAFGVLVSLVFNRGPSVSGNSRKEMANIKSLVPSKDYKKIAQEIRNMKRLWVGKGLDGLLKRRDEEANIVDSCI